MMMNIFSSFDPMWFNICYKSIIAMTVLLMLGMMEFWYNFNSAMTVMMFMKLYMMTQLKKTKSVYLKSLSFTMVSMFIMVIYMNILGLLPYMFSLSSHMIMTLSLSLPLWMLLMLSSMDSSMKKTMSYFLPDSGPLWLNPFLVIVESISVFVRPMTLSFRLAANMTTGHIILCLISMFSVSSAMEMFISFTLMSSIYVAFELGICIIQTYIFCLLVSLYSNDHS